MAIPKGNNKRFIKGLFKDTAYIDQPEGSWRYALNMIMQDKDGSISNETGNTLDGFFDNENFLVIGHIECDNDRIVLFLRDRRDDLNSQNYFSEIGIWQNGRYRTLYRPNVNFTVHNLNFDINYPIEGTFKVDAKQDLIVYFTDDLNPPRAFNVSRQQRELDNGNPVSSLYGLPTQIGSFGAGVTTSNIRTHTNHIELLNLFPNAGPVPHIDLDFVGNTQSSVNTGGGLRTGVYYLALAYVDEDNVATNYLTVSNPVSIVDEYDFTRPTFRKDGAKDGSQTSKSIKWNVTNLNLDYELVRPAIIRKMGGVVEVFKLPDVDAEVVSDKGVVFSGLEGPASGSMEEIIIDTVAYEKAKTIQQLDGVLYLGNLTSTTDLGYQKYANNIKLDSVVLQLSQFDTFYATVDNIETGFGTTPVDNGNSMPDSNSYRWAPNIFKYKGYQRDEVYAFYIAFILNDGSMSYAYHIPGRPDRGDELLKPSGSSIRTDLGVLSPYAANFHFFDSSNGAQARTMNYWQNATEFYPQTEDFEVWSPSGQLAGPAGSLQGKNVRHHHFPSNENSIRKTVADNLCSTVNSLGTIANQQLWNGRLIMAHTANGAGGTYFEDTYAKSFRFQTDNASTEDFCVQCSDVDDGSGSQVRVAAYQALIASGQHGNNNIFVADQPMQVTVRYGVYGDKIIGGGTTGTVRLQVTVQGSTTNHCSDSASSWSNGGCSVGWFSSASGGCGSGHTVNLDMGDQITIRGHSHLKNNGDPKWRQAKEAETDGCSFNNSSSCCTGVGGWTTATGHPNWNGTPSWIQFNFVSGTILVNTLTDAIIEHDINILGFELSDIRIPREIADKVQGFRIYYAKRKHADKRVLGQDYIKPLSQKKEIIGICEEGSGTNAGEVAQILGTLQEESEAFFSKDPWANPNWTFPSLPIEDKADYTNPLVTAHAYKLFSTHDFNLLRTKNSISGFTHIKLEYLVHNYVFNGPTINQDKKMNTTLINYGDSSKPVEVNEQWGYSEEMNCYPKEVKSALFFGGRYANLSHLANQIGAAPGLNPRILSQKAKTYLHGDSIFDGTALGFGGKIFNEFGESCMIFGLMDGHELPALPSNRQASITTGQIQDDWGVYHLSAPSILLLPFPDMGANVPAWDLYSNAHRSVSYLASFHAFRTDMYKSIDSQELVWTGFEVLGDDIEEFTFESDGTVNGTGQTSTVHPEGIFGGDTYIARYGVAMGLKPSNPEQKSHPLKAIYHNIVECVDNINFRHAESVDSNYFPATSGKEILKYVGTSAGTESTGENKNVGDYTHQDNMKYNEDYSAVNDIRTAIPLPLKNVQQTDFPTRAHRSAKVDNTSIIDNYRVFLANQFRDLPKNRGDLWKLSTFNNLLYFHMEDSLFAAKGKQSMQMKDGSEAFVGSGDIFQQEPDEIIQTEDGYGGTQSQWASLTTRNGYFFVDKARGKVFLMGDQLEEISNAGMEAWFRENLDSELDEYRTGISNCTNVDNPIIGLGLHSTWDPKYKKIILTKRDLRPTAAFKAGVLLAGQTPTPQNAIRYNGGTCKFQIWSAGISVPGASTGQWYNIEWNDSTYFKQVGWTISYFPELKIWLGFHSYIPYKYFNTVDTFYSFTDTYMDYLNGNISTNGVLSTGIPSGSEPWTQYGNKGIWKHNDGERGILYQEIVSTERTWYNFEFEVIHNELKNTDSLYTSFSYIADVYDPENNLVLEHGFTSFYVFNTFQISGDKTSTILEYLVNTRRVGNGWNINRFRDLAAIAVDSTDYYTSNNINIIGGLNTGTLTTSSTVPMFTIDGMEEIPTAAYLTTAALKPWNQQKKFIDRWLGIRLIYDNISNNLINLYSTAVGAKKLYR